MELYRTIPRDTRKSIITKQNLHFAKLFIHALAKAILYDVSTESISESSPLPDKMWRLANSK